MWTDEFRPRKWENVIGQESIKSIFTLNLEKNTFPQAIIFSGPAGTGKSSVAELVGKSLMCDHRVDGNPCYVCDSCKKNNLVRKFNMARYNKKRSKYDKREETSADDKSINEVIAEIFDYQSIDGKAVYILEELDCLSEENQAPFYEEMVNMPPNTYVIICTNYKYRITSQIRSRCVDTPFSVPNFAECFQLATTVLEHKGMYAPVESLSLLIDLCHNEPRSLVKYLEFFSASDFNINLIQEYFQTAPDILLDNYFYKFNPSISIEEMSLFIMNLEDKEPLQICKALPSYLMKVLLSITAKKPEDISPRIHELAIQLGTSKIFKLMEFVGQFDKAVYTSNDLAKVKLIMLKYQLEDLNSPRSNGFSIAQMNTESAARMNVNVNSIAQNLRVTNADVNGVPQGAIMAAEGLEQVSDLQLSNFFMEEGD